MDNRRAYFRISDIVEIQVSKLETRDEEQLNSLHIERCKVCDAANAELATRIEAPKTLKLIGRRYPEIIEYIQQLERRISELDIVDNNLPVGEAAKFKQLANISGDGIRFTATEPFAVGDMIELIMTLDPERYRFLVFGSVVRSEEHTSECGKVSWNTALHFTHIREEDQDHLIKHVMTRQMENLRVKSI